MYFKFSQLTGRLSNASQMEAFMPQGLNKYVAPEMPSPASKPTQIEKPAPITQVRASSSNAQAASKIPVAENVKRAQELFQRNNNLPVHLKAGPRDRVLYVISLALCGVGAALYTNFIYQLGWPKKQN